MPLGVVLGLVVGIFAGSYLAVRLTRARLNPDLAWGDVFALAVLAGSLIATALAALLLKRRDRIYRRLWEAENVDDDVDGVPDIYQRATGGGPGVSR